MVPRQLIAFAVFMALALPTVVASVGLRRAQERALAAQVAGTGDQFAVRLREVVAVRLALVESMAREMELGGLSPGAGFTERAEEAQARFPGFQAINWIDENHLIAQVVPREPNLGALGKSPLNHQEAGAAYQRMLDTGARSVTPPLVLFQGGLGFASYFPVRGKTRGVVNGVFRVQPLIEELLDERFRSDYYLSLDVGGQPALALGPTGEEPHEERFSVGTLDWSLVISASPALVARHSSTGAWWLLGLGLAGALFTACALAAWLARREEEDLLRIELERARRLEALGTLAGGIAHDFNNMLTVIGATVEDMQDRADADPEMAEDLDMLQSATRNAASLTKQLLAFAQHRVGVASPFSPWPVVQHTLNLLERLLPESIEVRSEVASAELVLVGDEGAFQQALLNLALNARDAMANGGFLTMKATAVEGEVRIEVSDTGSGMDESVVARVFDPFFSTKSPGKGTGLGLAMVKRTVDDMAGTITVDSKLGVGTSFALRFPASVPASSSGASTETVAPPPLRTRSAT